MKLATRLGLGFGAVLVLMTLVGYYAVVGINRISDLNRKLYEHPFNVKSAVLAIDGKVIRIHRTMKDVVLARSEEQIKTATDSVSALDREVLEAFKIIEQRFLGERTMYMRAEERFIAWRPIRGQVIRLVRAGQYEQAADITRGKGAAHVLLIIDALSKLEKFAEGKAAEFYTSVLSARDRARNLMYGILAAAIGLGIVFTILITRSVSRPAQEIAMVSEAIANGDLASQITYNGKDEIGQMAASLRNMLAGVIGEGQSIKNGIFVPLWTADQNLTVTFLNPAAADIAEKITGLPADEIVGRMDIGQALRDRDGIIDHITRICAESSAPQEEEVIFDLEDQTIILQEAVSLLLDSNGQPMGVMGVGADITKRKQAESEIRKALEEKEVLLREVHHRVKNNLQIMSSLLQLGALNIKDAVSKKAFLSGRDRIKAMALVHETLYQTDRLSAIDLGQYFERLVRDVSQTLGLASGPIDINTDFQSVILPLDKAVPCGLVMNELLNNAIEHAFPDNRPGQIDLTVRSSGDDLVEIVISDDGVGMPETDLSRYQTLGLQLVAAIVEDQLDGGIEMNVAHGTEFKLKFKPYSELQGE